MGAALASSMLSATGKQRVIAGTGLIEIGP
jgi:hypothetical protein